MIIGTLNIELRVDGEQKTLVVETAPRPGIRGGSAVVTPVSPEQLDELADFLRREAEAWRRSRAPKPVKEAVLDKALASFKPGKRTRPQ